MEDTLFRRHSAVLLGTAAFAVLWVIARAAVQSITIDEADTYLFWVARLGPTHWEVASNNHVLNSALMRLFTSVFGLHHLTVRAPAVVGAVVYIGSAYHLCRVVSTSRALQWALLVAMVYNPLAMDYLVAARGYGLALGFLLCALAVQFTSLSPRRAVAVSSLCLALSFASSFAFAMVDAVMLAAILLWRCRRPGDRPATLAAGVLPGLFVTLLLSSYAVLHWGQSQMTYDGATSLSQTFASVREASLYQPNPQLLNPLLYPAANALRPFLFPALGVACALCLIGFAVYRPWRRSEPARTAIAYCAGLFAIVACSLAIHYLAFCAFDVKLPLERHALYLVPLCTLFVGAVAATPATAVWTRFARRCLLGVCLLTSGYYVSCLRLTYFREWAWNADAERIYWLLDYYHRAYGVDSFATNWKCVAPLNFYRALYGRGDLPEFTALPELPAGRQVYVLDFPFEQKTLAANHLRVVYLGKLSEMAIAIDPRLEPRRACP
jgi:hypothetical protein